jgi:hypothetical protein
MAAALANNKNKPSFDTIMQEIFSCIQNGTDPSGCPINPGFDFDVDPPIEVEFTDGSKIKLGK